MNTHVPSMSIWLILAVICWFLAAFYSSFANYGMAGTTNRWGFFGGFGWLGMFFYGLFLNIPLRARKQ